MPKKRMRSGDGKKEFFQFPAIQKSIGGFQRATFEIAPVAVEHPLWDKWMQGDARRKRRFRGTKWVWPSASFGHVEAQLGVETFYCRYFRLPRGFRCPVLDIDVTVDDEFECSLNDKPIGEGKEWRREQHFRCEDPGLFRQGVNLLFVRARNAAGKPSCLQNPGGVLLSATLRFKTPPSKAWASVQRHWRWVVGTPLLALGIYRLLHGRRFLQGLDTQRMTENIIAGVAAMVIGTIIIVGLPKFLRRKPDK